MASEKQQQFPFLDEHHKFVVTTRPGFHLSCQLDIPSIPRESSNQQQPEIAVLCHGLYQTKDSATIVEASKALLQTPTTLDGAVRFDFHGEGDSDGFEQWSFGGNEDEMEDLRDVIEFLRSHQCHVKLILGHSRAATVVELYADVYGDVPLVVPVSGRFHMETGIDSHLNKEKRKLIAEGKTVTIKDPNGKERKVTPECVQKRLGLNMKSRLERIRNNPKQVKAICFIHGPEDFIIPISDAEEAFDILKQNNNANGTPTTLDVQFRIIDETGHDVGKSKHIGDYHLALRYLVEKYQTI